MILPRHSGQTPTVAPAIPDPGELRSAMPGVVVAIHANIGESVQAGDAVVTIETMKIEGVIRANVAGRLLSLPSLGDLVASGDVVATLTTASVRYRPQPIPDVIRTAISTNPPGRFRELDLNARGKLVRVRRTIGTQDCGIVVGLMQHNFAGQPGPAERVWLGSDPRRQLGAVAEPECRRIIAAFDYAEERGLPVEWVAVSSGARISMTSGTENMDWCAAVVRRILEFTQRGGQVVVIVAGINVGAQSYWNSVATMLGHCAGMLVMIEGTSMVLTGPKALARSGGVAAKSDIELGGYTAVMGPNGQAHHEASDLAAAYQIVLTHYQLCGPQACASLTNDPMSRDVCRSPYPGDGPLDQVGQILRAKDNPNRKIPYSVRPIMGALRDTDGPRLERWSDHAGAQGAVVWDTSIGGRAVSLIGIESHPQPNSSESGPDCWAGATLYPQAAKKISRALNAASGRRPVVVLANLAGFDGSAWSLRNNQLQWGAEIARSVVNFAGRIVVVITGRFHGGAYVVFNKALSPGLRMLAVEGTRVSVIGGSSAAEVVLTEAARDHANALQHNDPHLEAAAAQRLAHHTVGEQFDATHSVGRAFEMGSVDRVIAPEQLRPAVITELNTPLNGPVTLPADRPVQHASLRA